MLFNYKYNGNSTVNNYDYNQTNMSFVPDILREPTYFSGELGTPIEFREAISALHDVVISDLRFKPKDKTEYKEWAQKQEQIALIKAISQKEDLKIKIEEIESELKYYNDLSYKRLNPFYKAKNAYFKYIYERDKDRWFVLDPVITVHPDELFFECFSQDESSYGRLGVNYEAFKNIKSFSCGTTNIDYSNDLYNEFQKIRSYKKTFFNIDSSGFEIKTTGFDDYNEVKIDLPDSWVRGFLQVNSAMSMPMTKFDLHPMDIYNICTILRRNKENIGPRSLKYILKSNHPIKIIFEPWNIELECPRSIYYGNESHEIRVWGRKRILILERLIQLAKKFSVYLLGNGMPSFYIADLGHMNFTLGLSGWTKNDWSDSGNFDLMAPRANIDDITKESIFNSLKETWYEKPEKLSSKLNIDKSTVLGAMSYYTQSGKAIYDLNKEVYRVRELTKENLPMNNLRFSSTKEEKAYDIISKNAVRINRVNDINGVTNITGNVQDGYSDYIVNLSIDSDLKINIATCKCNWYTQNKLYKGPCEHMLALRIKHNKSVSNKLL